MSVPVARAGGVVQPQGNEAAIVVQRVAKPERAEHHEMGLNDRAVPAQSSVLVHADFVAINDIIQVIAEQVGTPVDVEPFKRH